ncbi:winged helix-turn-helix domain-containing protein [Streptomyces sp. NPDC096132]|uniref:helix-turn-helix domain-containing protein n=1 Tax=Streptomyces sp. NPDC096132 TaxID=3366075 RepID=UPI00381B1FDE
MPGGKAGWTPSPPRPRRPVLAGIRALIAWKFWIDCLSAGVWRLMHRHGWSWQGPARRAVERHDASVRCRCYGAARWATTPSSTTTTSNAPVTARPDGRLPRWHRTHSHPPADNNSVAQ